MLASAHAVLWTLGTFLALWGASLVVRGARRNRFRLACPACGAPVESDAAASCARCAFEPSRRRDWHLPVRQPVLIVSGLAVQPVAITAYYLGFVVHGWVTRPWDDDHIGPWQASALGVLAFALALGAWGWLGERARGRRRCPACWYDMSGATPSPASGDAGRTPSAHVGAEADLPAPGLAAARPASPSAGEGAPARFVCPECGHAVALVKDLYRPRRRWRAVMIAAPLLLAVYPVWLVPRVQRGGWRAAIPTTVLIAGLPWLPDACINEGDPVVREDWTLWGRLTEGSASEWQERWLSRRALGMLVPSADIGRTRRALLFVDRDVIGSEPQRGLTPARMRDRVFGMIADALVGTDSEQRSTAAALLVEATWLWVPREGGKVPMCDAARLRGLIERAGDADRRVAAAAMVFLLSCGEDADPALPDIVRLASAGVAESGIGAQVWARLATDSPRALDLMFEAATGEDAAARAAAMLAGRSLNVQDPDLLRRIVLRLDSPDTATAAFAAVVLTWRADANAPGVEAVVAAIESSPAHRAALVRVVSGARGFLGIVPYLERIAAAIRDEPAAAQLPFIRYVRGLPLGNAEWDAAVARLLDAWANHPAPEISRAATDPTFLLDERWRRGRQ